MIYLYYGENDLLRKRAVDELVAAFTQKYGVDAVSQINCSDIEPQRLIAEIVNINMFAPERLILLDSLDQNNNAWALIGENIARVPNDTSLVISVTSPDKRTKTFKTLKTAARVREFQPLKGHELADWVRQELASSGLEYTSTAVDELIGATGGDQWRLAMEVAKLRTLDQVVTPQLVRQYVEPSLEANAFMIFEQVISGRREAALAELEKVASLEDPNKFMGLLASQAFALAAVVHGAGQRDVASTLKIHPFQLSKMGEVARRMGDPEQQKERVKRVASLLAATDAKIKLSRPTEAWALISIAIGKM